jgi:hypothetical protein
MCYLDLSILILKWSVSRPAGFSSLILFIYLKMNSDDDYERVEGS